MLKNLFVAAAMLASPATAKDRPIGTLTEIQAASNGGLRDWQPGPTGPDSLYVRDRNLRWYIVKLRGVCPFDKSQDTIIYTTDSGGTFDNFSEVRVARYPTRLCGVAEIRTSEPPAAYKSRR